MTIRWPHRLLGWLSGSFHFLARFAGHSLRWVRINQVKRLEVSRLEVSRLENSRLSPGTVGTADDAIWICKQRTWYCHLPIMLGNFVWRFRFPSLRVLPTRQWLAWERAISAKRSEGNVVKQVGQHPRTTCHGLLVPAWPGEPLARLLQRSDLTDSQKFNFIVAASESLAQLHQIQIEGETPFPILLSHGDASVANVICHDASRSPSNRRSEDSPCIELTTPNPNLSQPVAIWFDFDLRHDLRIDPVVRHADDLRAFLFTLAWVYPHANFSVLLTKIRHVYAYAATWNHLKDQLEKSVFQTDLFHWAQLYRLEMLPPENNTGQTVSEVVLGRRQRESAKMASIQGLAKLIREKT